MLKVYSSNLPMLAVAEEDEALRENVTCPDNNYEKQKYLENISFENSVRFETPSEFLVGKIIHQVEFLFSDANILKDKFLLKHMRRNKEGYVSLKLISSLRKVKALSKDWRVVAYSLKKSQKLQMNDEMTKIRRIDPLPLPEVFDTSKTVLVFCYLPTCWTLENVKKQLNKIGTVVSMLTVNSKTDVMNVNVKRTIDLHEKIATFPFVVVKFETSDEAANAVLQTTHPSSVLKIVSLVEDENEISKYTTTSPKDRRGWHLKCTESPASFYDKTPPVGLRSYAVHAKCPEVSALGTIEDFKVSSRTETFKNSCRTKSEVHPQVIVKEKHQLPCTYKGDGPMNNTGSQRKHCFGKNKQSRVIILRQPKGPDGTIGFWERKREYYIKGSSCVVY